MTHVAKIRSDVGQYLRDNGLWLSVLLSIGVFFALVVFGDAHQVISALVGFEWSLFVLIIGLATLGYVVRFIKWELYLRTLRIDVPLRTSAIVFFSGLLFVATPGKVGELWKAWFMKETEEVPVSRTTSVVGAERITDFVALAMLAALGPIVYGRSVTLVAALFASLGVGLILIQWQSLFYKVLAAIETIPIITRYVAALEELYESTYALSRPGPFFGALGLSLVAWTFEAMALLVALRGYGIDGSALQSVFVYGFGLVVGAISMLPGGLGATEATMVGLLLSIGYERSIAVSVVLVVRVGTLWYAVLLGLVVYLSFGVIRDGR